MDQDPKVERQPGDEWTPEDPTEIDPGMIQLYGFARCRDCKAQQQIAITISLHRTHAIQTHLGLAQLGLQGPKKMFMAPENVLLPDGWGVDNGQIVCIVHNPNRRTVNVNVEIGEYPEEPT